VGHFRDPHFAAAVAIIFLMSVTYMAYTVDNPLFLQALRGDSPAVAGVMMLPAAVPPLLLSATAGRLAHKLGPGAVLTFGSLSLACGMLLLAVCGPRTGTWLLLIAYLLAGNGLAFLNAPANNVAVARLGPRNAGLASAILTSVRQIAGALGVAVSAVLLPRGASGGRPLGSSGLHEAYLVLLLATLLAALVSATVFHRAPRRPTRPRPASTP
jgi:predicted MFS family arabinose efflux permease